MSTVPAWLRQHLAALRALIVLTAVLGIAFPLLVTGVAQVIAPHKANGSVITAGGKRVASSLIGQSFTDSKGRPLKQWFQPRPSAVDYDGSTSGATNLGPENATLIAAIAKARKDVAAFDSTPGHPVSPDQVPADAVTSSGSGLDPDISVAYADQQVRRVAAARGLSVTRVQAMVGQNTSSAALGVFGTKVVNVVTLNVALSVLG